MALLNKRRWSAVRLQRLQHSAPWTRMLSGTAGSSSGGETKRRRINYFPARAPAERVSGGVVVDSVAGLRQPATGLSGDAPVAGDEGNGHPFGQHGCLSVSFDR